VRHRRTAQQTPGHDFDRHLIAAKTLPIVAGCDRLIDQTTHFLKAVTSSDVLADARVVRLGRTMSFGRVTLSSAADNKPVAMVSSAFAMLQGA
jgi:acyl-coenzyme A thioesterase PaaI-like protein